MIFQREKSNSPYVDPKLLNIVHAMLSPKMLISISSKAESFILHEVNGHAGSQFDLNVIFMKNV